MKRYEGARLSDIRKLTMNQILLLNHASSVNHERSDEYYEWKKQFDKDDKGIKRPQGDIIDVTQIPSGAVAAVMFGG